MSRPFLKKGQERLAGMTIAFLETEGLSRPCRVFIRKAFLQAKPAKGGALALSLSYRGLADSNPLDTDIYLFRHDNVEGIRYYLHGDRQLARLLSVNIQKDLLIGMSLYSLPGEGEYL